MRLRKALQANLPASIALVAIVAMASAIGSYILANQRLNPPAWLPVIGESHFELRPSSTPPRGSCRARDRR